MNHSSQMGVLHSGAHLREERKPCTHTELTFIAILGNRNSRYILHCEVRATVFRRAGVINPRDIFVRKERQCLALEFKAADDFSRGQTEFDDLERDATSHGRLLFRKKYIAHCTFADTLDDSIGTHLVGSSNAWKFRLSKHRIFQ